MSETVTLARPYARAAYDYAVTHHVDDVWLKVLGRLAIALKEEVFAQYLNRPELEFADCLRLFQVVLDMEFDQAQINFLELLFENNRLVLIPDIQAEYERLYLKANDTIEVSIETAYELNLVQEQLLGRYLEKRFGKLVEMRVKVNPDLIAGVIIRAGDQVIDDSVRSKIEIMRNSLLQ